MELLFASRSTEAKKIVAPALHLLFIVATAVAAAAPVALPGCPETCGSITVPYPFGTCQGCFREGFNLTCDETPGRPPRLLVGDAGGVGVEVVGISLADGTVRILTKMLGVSLPVPGNSSSTSHVNGSWSAGAGSGRLAVSTTRNRFVAMGCNLLAGLVAGDDYYVSVCAALCAASSSGSGQLGDTSCSGVGCCQTPVSAGRSSYGIQLIDLSSQQFQTPGSATASRLAALFIADQEWFARNATVLELDFAGEPQRTIDTWVVPAVLEWSLDRRRDSDMFLEWKDEPGSVGRCISLNSIIVEDGVAGFEGNLGRARCNCSNGFEGNPYIANGCQASLRVGTLAFWAIGLLMMGL